MVRLIWTYYLYELTLKSFPNPSSTPKMARYSKKRLEIAPKETKYQNVRDKKSCVNTKKNFEPHPYPKDTSIWSQKTQNDLLKAERSKRPSKSKKLKSQKTKQKKKSYKMKVISLCESLQQPKMA